MPEIVKRFFGFDTLLGVWLVKVVYFVGLAVIAGGVVAGFLNIIMTLASGSIVTALVQLVAIPAVAAVTLVYWRFLCEIFIVQFENHDRLIEIRERLGHWQF